MTESDRRLRVLHVVATGTRRGAELFASDLGATLPDWIDQRFTVLHPPVADGLFERQGVHQVESHLAVPGLRLDLRAVGELRSEMTRWKPHVVHAHGGEAFKNVAAAQVGLPVPVLYRKIGSAPPWIRNGIRLRAHRRLLRRADLIVAVAESVRRELISVFRVREEQIVVVPRGVDPLRLRPMRARAEVRRELEIDPDTPVVLSLGALNWEKDPLTHLRITLPEIRSRRLVHIFAGDGPLRDELTSTATQEGVGDRVRILGTRADVGDLLGASDVMLLASRTEGMPGCLIEAGMAGLPSVAFDVAGVTEVVAHERSGFVLTVGDLAGMRQALSTLASDPSRRVSMGDEARQLCARFDIADVARRYQDVYLRIGGRTAA
jgi:glycosyltransferase involved in cell wall biosynthesis